MPVHNGDVFLVEAIESVLGQTFEDFELVAVDDHSTDGTADILAGFALADTRVRVVQPVGVGFVAAVNAGIATCGGEWIARMDADDRSCPRRLEEQVRRLRGDPELSVLGTSVSVIDAEGRRQSTIRYPGEDEQIRLVLRWRTTFAHGSVVMRRAALVEVGGYRSDHYPAEDYDLWCRLVLRGARAANLDATLYEYRLSPDGTSRTLEAEQREMARAVGDAYARSHPQLPGLGEALASVRRVDRAVRSGQADPRALRRVARSLLDVSPWWARQSPRVAVTCVVSAARAEYAYRRARAGSTAP